MFFFLNEHTVPRVCCPRGRVPPAIVRGNVRMVQRAEGRGAASKQVRGKQKERRKTAEHFKMSNSGPKPDSKKMNGEMPNIHQYYLLLVTIITTDNNDNDNMYTQFLSSVVV